jgi:hypothetical protein
MFLSRAFDASRMWDIKPCIARVLKLQAVIKVLPGLNQIENGHVFVIIFSPGKTHPGLKLLHIISSLVIL